MLKRILIITLLASQVSTVLFAQSIADIQTPKLVPPSPDAAALGKYGQTPVDKSTGIPEISIPLYEIKTPRFSLPISLSYLASGVKVDETASWAGLNWSLNAGGVITRSVVGLPDDAPLGFLHQNVKKAADIRFPADSQYLQSVAQLLAYDNVTSFETQPDNFFYNFNGYAGAFVFGEDKKPVLTPYKPLRVNFSSTNGFDIVDEQGNQYNFNNTEYVASDISNELSCVSSWYLTRMVSADLSDTIRFVYTTDATYQSDFTTSFSQVAGPTFGASGAGAVTLWPFTKTLHINNYYPVRISSILFKDGKVDFITKGGRLDNANFSLDSVIVSNYNSATGQYSRLKSFKLLTDYFFSTLTNTFIPVTGKGSEYRLILTGLVENDQNSTVVKTHHFDYNQTMLPPLHNYGQDKWGYYNGKYANPSLLESQQVTAANSGTVLTVGGAQAGDRSVSPTYMQAGMLQRISYPTKGYTIFDFESNQQDLPQQVPYTVIAAAVGHYQETKTTYYTPTTSSLATGGSIFHLLLRRTGDIAGTVPEPPYVEVIRVSDNAPMLTKYANAATDVDSLVTIPLVPGQQYKLVAVAQVLGEDPNGSTSLLPYANISTTYQVPGPSVTTPLGGLRIADTKNYDSDSSLVSTETYKYSGGVLINNNLTSYKVTRLCYFISVGFDEPGKVVSASGYITTYANTSFYPLSTLNGSPVAYPYVTVYHGDGQQNTGKSAYHYNILTDSILFCPTGYNLQGIKPVPVNWKNGEPLWEGHYRRTGDNQYALEQEKYNDYSYISTGAGRGLIIGYNYEMNGWTPESYNKIWGPNEFYWFDNPVSCGVRVPQRTIVNDYDASGTTVLMTDTTNYFYDNPTIYLPTRTVSTDSKGHTITTYTYRPSDKAAINALTPLSAGASLAIDSMVSRNMLSPVLQQSQYLDNSLTQRSLTNYQVWDSHVIAPQNVQAQLAANPLETRLQFNRYDASGNALELQKTSDVKEVYLWGYHGQYPVAKILNTTYAVASTYITQSVLDNPPDDATLRSQLNNLRSIPNALVTTYTYKPLLGITSQTDPQGKTIYYEYDAFCRLKDIKDINGNIIKTIDYHYQSPN